MIKHFPLRVGRLVVLAIFWNVLLFVDLRVTHQSVFGPFSLLAYAGTSSVFLTIPGNAFPGSLFVADASIARRWRWLFWYFAILTGFFGLLTAYRLGCTILQIEPRF